MPLGSFQLRAMAAAGTLACLPVSGCSWVFVQKPPPGPIQAAPPLECTSSVVAPVLDTVWAADAAIVGLTLAIMSIHEQSTCSASSPCSPEGNSMRFWYTATGVLAAAAAEPVGFSAAYGYDKTSDCRHLKETQLSCTSGVEEACRALRER